MDFYDGEEDPQYIADVKAFMAKTIAGWNAGADDEDSLQWYSETCAEDFKKKFPFTISRFDERCSMDKEKVEYVKIPRNSFTQSTEQAAKVTHGRGGTTIISKTRVKPTIDPRTSSEDLRVAQVN